MSEITKPDFQYVWASGGSTVAPSNVKIQTGWTAEVPPFQWENWSQNRQDQAIAHVLQHGISVWDAVTEYQAGKSYVQGSDGIVYKAIQTTSGQNPATDTGFVYWSKSASGGLLAVKVISATSTYTPTPGTGFVVVEAVGGGGGSAHVQATSGGQYATTGGAGSGAYAKSVFTLAQVSPTIAVSIGAAGTAANAGGSIASTNGGATSFGSLITVSGGGRSQAGPITTGNYLTPPGEGGVTFTGATISGFRGRSGTWGVYSAGSGQLGGDGGSSPLGTGGTGVGIGISANPGTGYGAGGGGSSLGPSRPSVAGANGSAGLVIVWEYMK